MGGGLLYLKSESTTFYTAFSSLPVWDDLSSGKPDLIAHKAYYKS